MKEKLKTIAIGLLCIWLAMLCVFTPNIWHNVRLFLQQGQGAAQNIKNSTARADTFLDKQITVLESEQYQTLMRNNLAAGSFLQSITNSINTKTLPLLNKNLVSSNDGLQDLRALLQSGNIMLVDTNRSVIEKLLPQFAVLLESLTTDANRFGMTLDTFNVSLKLIADKAGLTLDEIYELAASPEWKAALSNVNTITANLASTSRHLDATSAEIEQAMQAAPSIAQSMERIARTSAKYQKALLIVGILGTLAKAFLP
jgi:hypothetical protein